MNRFGGNGEKAGVASRYYFKPQSSRSPATNRNNFHSSFIYSPAAVAMWRRFGTPFFFLLFRLISRFSSTEFLRKLGSVDTYPMIIT